LKRGFFPPEILSTKFSIGGQMKHLKKTLINSYKKIRIPKNVIPITQNERKDFLKTEEIQTLRNLE